MNNITELECVTCLIEKLAEYSVVCSEQLDKCESISKIFSFLTILEIVLYGHLIIKIIKKWLKPKHDHIE